MKKEIETLYINAIYNDESPNVFANKMLDIIGIDNEKQTRSSLQSRARWKYLTMVANVLNDKGVNYDVPGVEVSIKWTKDILYHIYWQSSREILFPGKKRQLNTKEFTQLTDHIMDLFAMIFDIHIPFPSIKSQHPPKE